MASHNRAQGQLSLAYNKWLYGSKCGVVWWSFHENPKKYDPPLAKACMHALMKAIGVKISVVTSATFDIGCLRLKKRKEEQKDEEMDGLVIFCQLVWQGFIDFWLGGGNK